MTTPPTVTVLSKSIRISGLEVARKDVADFFVKIDEHDREDALVQAIEVGVFCLERARNNSDVEYVRRQVEGLLSRVEGAVAMIPEKTQAALLEKIGSGDGQVLSPIKSLISETTQVTTVRLNDVRNLLAQDLDPAKNTSTIGKALQRLRELLDARRTDSVQATIENATRSITAEDGPLASVVRAVVLKAITPLDADLKELAKEVRGHEAVAAALEQTTVKGVTYEEEVVECLRDWAQVVGAEVEHVGIDNQPGDVLIKVPGDSLVGAPLVFVVEARDRQTKLGRKAISDVLAKAMARRTASAAIYLSRSRDGFAKEIGDWAEGTCEAGHFVACTQEHVVTAVRWLIVQERLQALRSSAPDLDAASIDSQIKRIRTSLDRVKSINRKVSEVRGAAQDIQEEAESLRDEIRGALSTMEDALRVPTLQFPPVLTKGGTPAAIA